MAIRIVGRETNRQISPGEPKHSFIRVEVPALSCLCTGLGPTFVFSSAGNSERDLAG